jgi:hypothetical protein
MRCEACLQAEVVTFNTCYKARQVCVIFLQYSYKCVQARKLTWGNQRATALSLAAKGSVVTEKHRTRCPFKGRVLIQGTVCNMENVTSISLNAINNCFLSHVNGSREILLLIFFYIELLLVFMCGGKYGFRKGTAAKQQEVTRWRSFRRVRNDKL